LDLDFRTFFEVLTVVFGLGSFDFRSLHAERFFHAINAFAQRFDEPTLLSGSMKPNVNILRLDTDLGGKMLTAVPASPGFFQTD
jgi:hypothetical protein